VAQAIVESKTRIIDIDLRAYFDNVQHYLLLEKVARRVRDRGHAFAQDDTEGDWGKGRSARRGDFAVAQ
jgi:hypothetical protein